MPQAIDKAAIAKQLGAVPIEEKQKIAQELGATPIATPKEQDGFISSFIAAINPMPAIKQVMSPNPRTVRAPALDTLAGGAGSLGSGAQDVGNNLIDMFIALSKKRAAAEAGVISGLGKGNLKEAGKAFLSGVPGVSTVAEQAEEGNYRGAAGTATGLLTPFFASKAAKAGLAKVGRVTEPAAESLYRKALQPPPRMYETGEAKAMVKTALKEGLPIGQSGLTKLDKLVSDLNKSIEGDIATNPQVTVSPTAVASRMRSASTTAAKQVNPEADLATIASSKAEFLRQHQTPGIPQLQIPPADIPIPASLAQEIKKGTYRQIGSKPYGELSGASVEAQKQLARGIKEELEIPFPEIKMKNLREGKLLDLRPELEAAVNRLGNRRISVANVLNIMANPQITSRLALILYNAGVPAAAASARINEYKVMLAAASIAAVKDTKKDEKNAGR